jgi:RNA polymerase sigma-70 factor (ECF subfamily)
LTDPLAELIRIEGGQVLATLIRLTGDIDRAEDAVQDAAATAAATWRRDGVPDRPGAWLTTVAKRKALDRLRRESRRSAKEQEAQRRLLVDDDHDATSGAGPDGDDRLRLLFTCCHPALGYEAQVALALRTICGLSTAEIAAAFLVPEPTAGQRISRAKAKIRTARIPYRVPEPHELPDRLDPVLATVYLVFITGHHAPAGPVLARVDLATEAIRLGRLLSELMPDEGECRGLLALMLATDARRRARLDEHGDLVLLADQDRRRWDHAKIAEAAALVEATLRRGRPGPHLIQAAIACLHGLAPTAPETDWAQIAELYGLLEQRQPTPVVRVNRAVAVAEVAGPEAGLALLEPLTDTSIERWHLYWSTRADFLRRLGRQADAAAAYSRAIACEPNETDRRFLLTRLAEVSG